MALAQAHVEILADTSRFERDLQSKLSKSGTAAGKSFNKSFNSAIAKGAQPRQFGRGYAAAGTKAGQQFARSFSRAASNINVNAKFSAKLKKTIGKDGKSVGASFGKSLLKGMAAPLTAIGKLLSSVMDLGGSMGGKGGGAFAALGTAAVAAGAAVGPLLGFLAAIPAAIGGAAAAVATLAVAFQGVGEAISAGWSGDMAKFEESLKKLAPAAQTVVRDIVGLKPAIDGLKQSVQGAFFQPLVGQVSTLATVISGPLQAGMTNLSGALGEAAASLVNFFASPVGAETLKQLFDGIAVSVREITPGLTAMVGGFARMAAVGASSFGGLGEIFQQIGNAMTSFANSGGLNTMLESAAHAASQLGQAFAGLWPGIQAMMGPLGTIGEAVRSALIPAFTAVGQVLTTLAPVFNQIFGILGGVLQAVIPPLATAFTGLAQIIASLLGPALAVLGPIILQIANTLGPVLTQILGALVPKLVELANVAGPLLAEALKAVGWAVNMLMPIFQSFAAAVVPIIQTAFDVIIGIFNVFAGLFTGDWNRMWEGIKQIIWSAKETIINIFAGLGRILRDAGGAIIQGLIDGAKAVWEKGKAFFGGIGDWIAANKGPISYDRRLLIPAGRAIMQGFHRGIQTEWPNVARTISGITRDIPGLPGLAGARPVNPNALRTSRALGFSDRLDRGGVVNQNRTTTVNAPITVRSSSANPASVARRTADRLARFAVA
jgi:phage-related protein